MSKIRRTLFAVVIVLLIATLGFIWSNSLQTVPASSAESGAVLVGIEPLMEAICGAGNVTEQLIRKMAHFIEFGALGGELALLVVLRGRPHVQTVANALFAGLAAAVADEALQLTSGRGSMVLDILLDFSGILAGAAFVLPVYCICAALRKRKTKTAK